MIPESTRTILLEWLDQGINITIRITSNGKDFNITNKSPSYFGINRSKFVGRNDAFRRNDFLFSIFIGLFSWMPWPCDLQTGYVHQS